MSNPQSTWCAETAAPEATEAIGAALARLLPQGAVLALYGDLASGKTCLVRGMARFFAGHDAVHSPTFTLVNEYGANPALFHLDLYRLRGPEDLVELGYEELFDSGNICAIEWAERAEGLLPEGVIRIHLEHAGGECRRIVIEGVDAMPVSWREQLDRALAAL